MKHEYTTAEVARILGRSPWTITQYGNKGFIKRTAVKGSGRAGINYVFAEEDIQACADKIGLTPNWEASERVFKKPEPIEEPKTEEPASPEAPVIEVISEYYMISLGLYWLTDKNALSKDMNAAKKFASEALDTAKEQCAEVGGTLKRVKTTIETV